MDEGEFLEVLKKLDAPLPKLPQNKMFDKIKGKNPTTKNIEKDIIPEMAFLSNRAIRYNQVPIDRDIIEDKKQGISVHFVTVGNEGKAQALLFMIQDLKIENKELQITSCQELPLELTLKKKNEIWKAVFRFFRLDKNKLEKEIARILY